MKTVFGSPTGVRRRSSLSILRARAKSVSTRDGLLLRREDNGSLVTYADLSKLSDPPAGNELVADGRGNAYINGGGFNLMAGEPFAPGIVALVTPDGVARQVAEG